MHRTISIEITCSPRRRHADPVRSLHRTPPSPHARRSYAYIYIYIYIYRYLSVHVYVYNYRDHL